MQRLELVILDMAGTTMVDNHEVEHCFSAACKQTGIIVSDEEVLAVQGWKKDYVFQYLWKKQLGESHSEIPELSLKSYNEFQKILENHYQNNEVNPTQGCVETLSRLREMDVKIALTTGFYRGITDILLEKLGWFKDLNAEYMGNGLINLSLSSDMVQNGRPAADMILLAMKKLGVSNSKSIVNVGDTPSDLASGKNANVALSLGLTNGTHAHAQLEKCDNDGLLGSMFELIPFMAEKGIILPLSKTVV